MEHGVRTSGVNASVQYGKGGSQDETTVPSSREGHVAKKPPKKPPTVKKVVEETIFLKRPRRSATLKEEVWQDEDGSVVKYNLAYVNPPILRGRS